ncbi:MAG: hypothetical protein ISS13_02920 [Actinobacteria bacterium]|nr:hypothetical protein [Actinomycetota bacterium]
MSRTVDAVNGEKGTVVDEIEDLEGLTWSPDGQHIAYTTRGKYSLFVVTFLMVSVFTPGLSQQRIKKS